MPKRLFRGMTFTATGSCLLFTLLLCAVLSAQDSNNSASPLPANMPEAQVQNNSAPKPSAGGNIPQFRARTELVLVPVLVHDKSGKHIPGLTGDKFILEENGRTPPIGLFEEVKTGPASADNAAASFPGHSNFALGADARDWRLTIVVLDMLNTPFLRQAAAKKQLTLYLSRSLRRDEPTALLGLSSKGLVQLHGFTTDTQVLVAALNRTRGEITRMEMNLTGVDQTESLVDSEVTALDQFLDAESIVSAFQQREVIWQTLDALKHIAQAYAAIPGRKTLIWATAGFPFMIDDPLAFQRMGYDMMQKYEDTWRLLVAANIAVYPVDTMGLVVSTGGRYNREFERISTLRSFADATGGKVCVNSNDLVNCFGAAVEDASSYYLLAFYLSDDDRKPGWRKLKVKVDAEGAHVRAREGFYVSDEKPDTPEARRKEVIDALASPVEYTGVLLNLRWLPQEAPPADADAGIACPFSVFVKKGSFTIDAERNNALDITLMTLVIDKNNKLVADPLRTITASLKPETVKQITATNGMALRERVVLPKGSYQVRVLVRDNPTGRMGTVIVPLEVK